MATNMSFVTEIAGIAREHGCEFRENAPMAEYTSFKTGGCADIILFPHSCECLSVLLAFCFKAGEKPFVFGNGSNLLVSDAGIRGVSIRMGQAFGGISANGNEILCSSGVSLSRLCAFALENSLTGLEFAYGIPGTAGGAAYMNAGAYGGEMKDVLVECRHLSPNGVEGGFAGDELQLGYRHSAYAHGDYVITALKLRLQHGERESIRAKMNELLGRRKDKQPLDYPSAGSTFKRPEGHFAGALIEQCGLKGCCIGGAAVSEKHAGFIINRGKATSADILKLIEYVQNTVLAQTGIQLETEVKIVK